MGTLNILHDLITNRKGILIVGSDSGKISIIEFDASLNDWKTVHCEVFGKTGCRRIVPGQYLAADPKGRAILIAGVEKQKFVYVMNRDSANRLILDIYGKLLKTKNDRRWRIEHAQVVDQQDVPKFGKYSIIPSIHATHGTSDMYWADERLGDVRVKTAYAFQDLLKQNGFLANGSDFPVEFVNPLYGFHSAVARQDAKNFPEGGYQMENALTREQALKAMTIWSAYANFEEKERGSIERGKMADFVILEDDLMLAPKEKLRNVKVLNTYVGGEKVH